MRYVRDIETPLGRFAVAATERQLLRILLPPSTTDQLRDLLATDAADETVEDGGELTDLFAKQLSEYLDGHRREFDIPYRIDAPPFHTKVLEAVARIPYGTTSTYADIAAAVGNPGATRAVGTANARNRLPIIIPCHRVVASNGIGGYGGGPAMKRQLLSLEAAGRQESMNVYNH